jgi:putative membrane protein
MNRLRGEPHLANSPDLSAEKPPPGHIPAAIAGRMYAQAARWHTDGKLDLPGLWAIETNIRALMDAAGHCERIAQPPVPASFHALLRHGLLLSLVLAPWHLIHALGLWALPVQALIIYFLFGIELTAEEIENPFGYDVDDLPLGNYCVQIQADVAEILGTADQSPSRGEPAAALEATVPTVTEEHGH